VAGYRHEDRTNHLKNPLEILKEKEAQLIQIKLEIDALKIAIPLLENEADIKSAEENKFF